MNVSVDEMRWEEGDERESLVALNENSFEYKLHC